MAEDVKVVYVSELVASGFVNGVVNMAFSTYQFIPAYEPGDPDDVEDKGRFVVAPSPILSANLRFDLRLAQIMRDRLEQLIEDHTKPQKAPN